MKKATLRELLAQRPQSVMHMTSPGNSYFTQAISQQLPSWTTRPVQNSYRFPQTSNLPGAPDTSHGGEVILLAQVDMGR